MEKLWRWAFAEGDRSPATIRARVTATPTPIEAIVAGSIAIIVVASMPYSGNGIDWEIFAGAADGQFVSEYGLGYYYAYWLLPLFDLYALPGVAIGGVLWSLTNLVGLWFAARVFGARPALVLAGFGALSGFYTGTITGVAVGALAGIWWALHEERWVFVGALSLLAVAKPQWGVVFVVAMLASARPPLRAFPAIVAAPIVAATASFAAYGWWPAEILERAETLPPEGNGSLWPLLGPVALMLWAALALPMSATHRRTLAVALSLMAVPYVQQYDYIALWVLTGDGLGLISYLDGPLIELVGREAARAVQIAMPMAVYLRIVVPATRRALGARSRSPHPSVGRRRPA